jgi:DNA-binding NarL/FixJ family response regulator
MNGLEVARLLRQELPEAKILVISQHDPIHLLPSVVEAGGNACVDKSRLGADLVASIKNIEVLPALSREPVPALVRFGTTKAVSASPGATSA